MHVPSIRQSATVGIAFCAIVAVAAPVATPVDLGADAVDIVKVEALLTYFPWNEP